MAIPTTQDVSPDATPARMAKLDAFGGAGWLDELATVASLYAPGATQIRPVDLLTPDILVPANTFGTHGATTLSAFPYTQTAAVDGGGRQPTGNSGWTNLTTQTVIQAPKTTAWVAYFDVTFPVPASGKVGFIGLGNATQYAMITHQYAVSQTLFVVELYQGGTVRFNGPAIDGLRHRIGLAYDGASVTRLIIDGVSVASTTDITRHPLSPVYITIRGDTAPALLVSRAAFATVA